MTRGARTIALITAALLCAIAVFAQGDIVPRMIVDHTPGPPARDVPVALADLALPEGALERLTGAYADDEGVRSVQIAWLSGDRYLWRIELDEPLAEGQSLNLYINCDLNTATGRLDAGGAELLAQWGPGYSRLTEWMADNAVSDSRGLRTAVEGSTLWATIDYPLLIPDGAALPVFWITSPVGDVPVTEASVPAEGPRPVHFDADGEEVGGGGLRLVITGPVEGDDEGRSFTYSIANTGNSERWIDFSLPFAAPLEGPVSWFDGFNFTPHTLGETPISFHGTSAVTPLTAAWNDEQGIALAFDPQNMYTEAHSSIRPTLEGAELRLGSRVALMPDESQVFTVRIFSFDGRLGWRGAFEAYWKLYPEFYERARDIDPRFHGASAGGLYRSWNDPEDERFASDLIRRMHGHWEWGYAPAPRPGEWAVTDLSIGSWTNRTSTKSATAESLAESREYIRRWVHDNAQRADVAVAYYMHLKNVEKGLMEQYWPDSYFQNEPIEYIGYYAGVPCWFAYPWADSYGDYLVSAIPLIAQRFSPAGFAFDSVFGQIPHWGPSADRSPGTTFENGRAFVGEGIGFARQMDEVRKQHTNGFRSAMVTNLKLPTLSCDAVRTDTALLEHHPMNNPSYRERFLRLRMLSGQTMFNWWHTYNPDLFPWIPWDRLTPEQTIDAFRRLRDDVLIHSLYYGGVPNGRFAVGVPKLMRAIPMLLEVADLGWQPVIGAQAQGGELLISRFGSGPGMALGVGNQTYEAQVGSVVIDESVLAGATHYAFATWGDGATNTDLRAQPPTVSVSVGPRDVTALRVVVGLPRDLQARATITGQNALPAEEWRKHLPGSWTIDLEDVGRDPFDLAVWLPEQAGEVTATVRGRPVTGRVSGAVLHLQVNPQGGAADLVVSWQPKTPLQGDEQELLDFPFVANGAPNCNVVACGDTRDLAFRVQEYFREYYRWAVEEPQRVKLPIVDPEEAPAGRRVVVALIADLPADLQIDLGQANGGFGVRGDTVYATAATPEGLEQAVEGLLFTLDQKYEYWGPFFPTQNFFDGDPSKSPQALQDAEMAGRTLTGDDAGSLREVIELPDLIEWH